MGIIRLTVQVLTQGTKPDIADLKLDLTLLGRYKYLVSVDAIFGIMATTSGGVLKWLLHSRNPTATQFGDAS